jgi:dTDP-4-dehydrorhamnose 3,5-epimerase
MSQGDSLNSSALVGKKDQAAPSHSARIEATEIEGVELIHYPQVNYADGTLTEVFHPEWSSLFREPIEHCYFVLNRTRSREAWYYHEVTTDRYSVIFGEMEMALFDPRNNSQSKGKLIIVKLAGLMTTLAGAHGIRIAPGVWHSFKNSQECSFMNFKTPPYNRKSPDKFRLPMPNELCDFNWPEE